MHAISRFGGKSAQDALDLRSAKFARPGALFETGQVPTETPTVQLQKLLLKAGKAAGVVVPKKLLTDIDKEPGLLDAFTKL